MSIYNSQNIKSLIPDKALFLISWHVTGWCNFHCPYCIDGRNKSKFTPIEEVTKVAKQINMFINKNVEPDLPIKLRLYGGEPSFYPWTQILDNIERINELALPTNFSNSIDYYKDLYKYCFKRHIKLILNCSCHPEAVDFIPKMIELTKWCKENKTAEDYKAFLPPINTFVVDNNFDFNIIKTLEDNGVNKLKLSNKRDLFNNKLQLNDFWNSKITEYTDKYQQLTASKKNKGFLFNVTFNDGYTEPFINQINLINKMDDGGFDTTNFYCNAGTNNIAIWENGDVSLARCEYLINKRIGNIFDENFKLPKKWFRCGLNDNKENNRCPLCHNTSIVKDL